MHEIEPTGISSLQEYQYFLEHRVQASELTLGGLYLVLADIREQQAKLEAIKFPVRIKTLELQAVRADVSVDILNLDLKPTSSVSFTMKDGIAVRPDIWELSTNQQVKEMYIKDYEDFLDPGDAASSIEEEVGRHELVPA
jgi:hypothetical protein